MNPYPFWLENHFTVPEIFSAMFVQDFTVVLASTVSEVDITKKRMVAADMAAKRKAAAALKEEVMAVEAPTVVGSVMAAEAAEAAEAAKKKKPAKKRKKNDGDISVMREERRDLYDLLYGDEAESSDGSGDKMDSKFTSINLDDDDPGGMYDEGRYETSGSGGVGSQLDDDNLDTFDPYGLEDF